MYFFCLQVDGRLVYNGRGGGFEGVGAYNAAVYGNINSIVYFNIYKQNTCQKPRTLKLKTAERISRLKKIPWRCIEFHIQNPHYIK